MFENCRLLAKVPNLDIPNRKMVIAASTLIGHNSLALMSMTTLLESLGWQILEILNLRSVSYDQFSATAKLAIYLHDWGKANSHQQEMYYVKALNPDSTNETVRSFRKKVVNSYWSHGGTSILRHEIVTAMIAMMPELRLWLSGNRHANFAVALWSAIGHHLRVGVNQNHQLIGNLAELSKTSGNSLRLYLHHSDFRSLLRQGRLLGLPKNIPNTGASAIVMSGIEMEECLRDIRTSFVKFEKDLSAEDWKFLAAMKALTIAADLVGSAVPLKKANFKHWIHDILQLTLTQVDIQRVYSFVRSENSVPWDFDENDNIRNRLLSDFSSSSTHDKFKPKPSHQIKLISSSSLEIRTHASYHWALKWAIGCKLFFCYPTTREASTQFLDYDELLGIQAKSIHSKDSVERQLLFGEEDSDNLEKTRAFSAWHQKVIFCTVDSVLGLIQNYQFSLHSWIPIVQGAFVFEQVSSYDSLLFGALLKFIKVFSRSPILISNASDNQVKAIEKQVGDTLDNINLSPDLEKKDCYKIVKPRTINLDTIQNDEIFKKIVRALSEGQKVLWVANSVKSAIAIYRQFKKLLSPDLVLIGHARYRYKERLFKDKALLDAFSPNNPKSCLAITTQVSEFLHLTTDILISPVAPIPSIIKRLERFNISNSIKEAIFYNWDVVKPYESKDIDLGNQFLTQISDRLISYEELQKVADSLNSSPDRQIHNIKSQWLEGNWQSCPGFLYSGKGTANVLLEVDLEEINGLRLQRTDKSFYREAQKWTLPVPVTKVDCWRRCSYSSCYWIAPQEEVCYHEETGLEFYEHDDYGT